jgi:hypothetical protein
VEKLIPIRRVTTIVMPYRAVRASLRPGKATSMKGAGDSMKGAGDSMKQSASKFRSMSAIQILKFGLNENLWKKRVALRAASARGHGGWHETEPEGTMLELL